MSLSEEIRAAINRISRENVSNTPDFILAEYLMSCLVAFESANMRRENWYGKHLCIGGGAGQNIESPVNNTQQAQSEICECKYCKDTGYLSSLGESVQANEHSPGWKYCPYCSRKLSAVR